MPETDVLEQPKVETPEPSPFGQQSWTDKPPEPKTTEQPEDNTAAGATPTPEVKNTVPDTKGFLKEKWGWDSEEAADTEIKELRLFKSTPQTPAELKFENEQSKQFYELVREGKTKEVREFLETQEKLNSFTATEVTSDTAADIIKLGMQLKYKELTPKEIEYKFNKEFGLPSQPIRKEDELDEEFEARKQDWTERVGDVQMARSIEAKLAKPELEKLKSQLVLPEISKQVQNNEPTKEQVEALEKVRQNFLIQLESNYSKVEGFTTKVKDESVEFPVSFKIPDEEKTAIKGRLTEGLDVNQYIDKRWFDEKGNPKIENIIEDIYQLENLDKILSGVANNAAYERLSQYQKAAKNIDLNGNTSQQTFQQGQNGASNNSPFATASWSDKPPSFNN